MSGVRACWDQDCFRKRDCTYDIGTVGQQDSTSGRQAARAPCSPRNFSVSSFILLETRHLLLTMHAEPPGGVNIVP